MSFLERCEKELALAKEKSKIARIRFSNGLKLDGSQRNAIFELLSAYSERVQRLEQQVYDLEGILNVPHLLRGYMDNKNNRDLTEHDKKVLMFIRGVGPVSMVELEKCPPEGLSAKEARVSAQRMVSYGELHINSDLKLAIMWDRENEQK